MHLIHTIFEPEGAGPHPTILALHGMGANALDLLGLAPYLCDGRCLVLCPQAPLAVPLGPQGPVGYAWFPRTSGGPPDLAAVQSSHTALQSFIDEALERYPCDPRKLIVLGFSQGGVMAYNLALHQPGRFAALVALSTWLPQDILDSAPDLAAARQLPIMVQHGSRDEMIAVDRARQSVEAMRPANLAVTYREYDMGHEINGRSLRDVSTWLEEKILAPVITAG
ncbi:MAG: alpha/beta fold hydrolase [Candidatus Tectomicrobia bacterium]|uniref:Alpha/beta fold hydrolase n=1 Tax=Tectimicrobiota bacterium TaxID=2528274 RepID=A0A938B210_UNCTE|nr:alpha/beta fold hydrolase [Candidatus Tectomicrobia bacterium]